MSTGSILVKALRGAAKNVKFGTGSVKKFGGWGALHGTDVRNIEGILKKGLKPGSALDFNKEWVEEYPVVMSIPTAEKGKYIEHNKYHTSAGTTPVKSVTVDMDHYEHRASGKIKEDIMRIAEENPKVKFNILNDAGEYKPRYTLDDAERLNTEMEKLLATTDPKVEQYMNTIKALENKFRGPDGIIRNMSRDASKIRDELYEAIKIADRLRNRKLNNLDRQINEAWKDIDYEIGSK